MGKPLIKEMQLNKIWVARKISAITNPALVAFFNLFLLLYLATGDLLLAINWTWLFAIFVIFPATCYLVYNLRKGNVTDADLSVRQQRDIFYLLGSGCMGIYFLFALWLYPNFILIVLLLTALLILISFAIITRFWTKISIHSGAIAGLTTSCAFFSIKIALVAGVATLAVLWSRLILKHHTVGQIILSWIVASGWIIIMFLRFLH